MFDRQLDGSRSRKVGRNPVNVTVWTTKSSSVTVLYPFHRESGFDSVRSTGRGDVAQWFCVVYWVYLSLPGLCRRTHVSQSLLLPPFIVVSKSTVSIL